MVLKKNINTYNVFTIAFHEWIALFKDLWSSKNFTNALSYFYKPPGWQPVSLDPNRP